MPPSVGGSWREPIQAQREHATCKATASQLLHHYVNCNIPTHWRYTENERKWSHNWQFISPNHFTLKRRKQRNSSNFKLRSEARGFRLHTAEHRACTRLHWSLMSLIKITQRNFELWVMTCWTSIYARFLASLYHLEQSCITQSDNAVYLIWCWRSQNQRSDCNTYIINVN